MNLSGRLSIIASVVLAFALLSGCLQGAAQNQIPQASLSANPTSGGVPLLVTFTISASDPDGSIATWNLDVDGDSTPEYSGQGSPPSTKQHTYQSPGSYVANLAVTDNDGAEDTAEVTVTATATGQNQFPSATLSAALNTGPAPFTVDFMMVATDPDGSIESWSLDADNDGAPDYSGQGSPPATRQHTYQVPGEYTANLTVFDNGGASDFDNEIVSVTGGTQNQRPSCSLIAIPNTGAAPLAVTFTMNASDADGSIQSWSIDVENDGTPEYFGIGVPPTTRQHAYTANGTYASNLTVTDDMGAMNWDTEVIVVGGSSTNQRPTVSLIAYPNVGMIPFVVTFAITASDSDGSIQSWSLDANGDGSAEYSGVGGPPATKQHTYQTAGSYTANLTVIDNQGAAASDYEVISAIVAQNQRPTVSIVASPNSGPPPLVVTFTIAASDSDGSIQSWSLDIDNDGTPEYSGTSSPPATKQHTYQVVGTHVANITVADNVGAAASDYDIIRVVEPVVTILINEMEQNPVGPDEGNEWVELYNPNAFSVNLGGYRLQTTVVPVKIHYLGPSDVIAPGGYLVITFSVLFLNDLEESVILFDDMNREIDRTAVLNDDGGTDETWQRIPNGYDTDQASDWQKKGPTKGTENIL